MAFNDALFQLGMDLTRSSPAHEEDTAVVSRIEREDCGNEYIPSLPLRTVAIDLVGAAGLTSSRAVERAVKNALSFARLGVTGASLKRQGRPGSASSTIKGTVSCAGGRVTVEAWPATGKVSIDMHGALRPEIALMAFADAFEAREAVLRRSRTSCQGARTGADAMPSESFMPVRKAA